MTDNKAFLESLKKTGEDTLRADGSINLMFVGVDAQDQHYPILIGGYSPETRDEALGAVQSFLKSIKAKKYGILMETWFASYDSPSSKTTPKPSQRDDRKEAMVVAAVDNDSNVEMEMYQIERDKDGKPYLSEKLPTPGNFGGDFVSLLSDDVQFGTGAAMIHKIEMPQIH